jgi:hypothetical protein
VHETSKKNFLEDMNVGGNRILSMVDVRYEIEEEKRYIDIPRMCRQIRTKERTPRRTQTQVK